VRDATSSCSGGASARATITRGPCLVAVSAPFTRSVVRSAPRRPPLMLVVPQPRGAAVVITTGIRHRWIAAVRVVAVAQSGRPGRASHSPNLVKTCSRRGKGPSNVAAASSFCRSSPGGHAIDRFVDFFLRDRADVVPRGFPSRRVSVKAQRADQFGRLAFAQFQHRPEWPRFCAACDHTLARSKELCEFRYQPRRVFPFRCPNGGRQTGHDDKIPEGLGACLRGRRRPSAGDGKQ
jgi:hypothetical protein